jgi:hypothetical protein
MDFLLQCSFGFTATFGHRYGRRRIDAAIGTQGGAPEAYENTPQEATTTCNDKLRDSSMAITNR